MYVALTGLNLPFCLTQVRPVLWYVAVSGLLISPVFAETGLTTYTTSNTTPHVACNGGRMRDNTTRSG
jgi:hypothetical protein